MRKSIFMIAALIMLTACGDKKNQVGVPWRKDGSWRNARRSAEARDSRGAIDGDWCG